MKNKNYILQILPGLLLAVTIALVAKFLESILPISILSASLIALFIGMAVNQFRPQKDNFGPGLDFATKRVLKFAIILLGASLNIYTIFNVGKMSLAVMFFTLLTCFGLGHFVGRALGLNWKMSNLISAGTGICGGSAIAAIAPAIEAEDLDIAYAMSATFIFDMVMIVLFPIMGRAMDLSDIAFGLWAGTAINDTSSVVAASYAYSEAAGNFATMVKLTRTLTIIPAVIIFSLIHRSIESNKANNKTDKHSKADIKSAIPWFILGFLLMAGLNSLGLIPTSLSTALRKISKFLMVIALASIGLNTSFADMQKAGPRPMVHGFIISALVVIVALAVEYHMGLV